MGSSNRRLMGVAVAKAAAVAGALGVGWYLVLLAPRITREWLVSGPVWHLTCLVIASVIVGSAGRRFIERAETFAGDLVRAFVMPYAGGVVYLTAWALLQWLRHPPSGGFANLHDVASLYLMGVTAITVSFPVVIPYGWLCQRVMKAVYAAFPERDLPDHR